MSISLQVLYYTFLLVPIIVTNFNWFFTDFSYYHFHMFYMFYLEIIVNTTFRLYMFLMRLQVAWECDFVILWFCESARS